jgi:hypothetical protein
LVFDAPWFITLSFYPPRQSPPVPFAAVTQGNADVQAKVHAAPDAGKSA